MRRGELFLGSLLIILGGLFLLKTTGYLAGDVLGWFWPFCILAAGVWVLLDALTTRSSTRLLKSFSVPLQGAREAALTIEHGAGRITLGSGAGEGEFLSGEQAAGMEFSARLDGERLNVKIQAGPSYIPIIGPPGGVWTYRLNPAVPTSLTIHSGASGLDVNLADLSVTRFAFEGGASRLSLTLPARMGSTISEIEAGAAGIDVSVPEGVGLRLHTDSVGILEVDQARFPRREAGLYESADFDSAKYHADVRITGGATSIRVH